MGKIFCKRHERFYETGAACDYCETPAASAPPRPADSCFCGIVDMQGVAPLNHFKHAGSNHRRDKCWTPAPFPFAPLPPMDSLEGKAEMERALGKTLISPNNELVRMVKARLPKTPAGRLDVVQELLAPRDENGHAGQPLVTLDEARELLDEGLLRPMTGIAVNEAAQLLEVPADAKCPECGGTRTVGGHALLCPTRPVLSTKEREFVKEVETFYGIDAKGLSYPEWRSGIENAHPPDLEQALKDAAALMEREGGKPDLTPEYWNDIGNAIDRNEKIPVHGVYRELTKEEWNQPAQSPAASLQDIARQLKAAEDKLAADFCHRAYLGADHDAASCGICKMVNSALRPPSNLEQLANAPPSAGPVQHQWSTHHDLCLYCGKRGSELANLDAKMPCWFYADARALRERQARQEATDYVAGAATYRSKPRRKKMNVKPILGGMAVPLNYKTPQGATTCFSGPLLHQKNEIENEGYCTKCDGCFWSAIAESEFVAGVMLGKHLASGEHDARMKRLQLSKD